MSFKPLLALGLFLRGYALLLPCSCCKSPGLWGSCCFPADPTLGKGCPTLSPPASLSFDPLQVISLARHPRKPSFQPPVLTLLTADCGPCLSQNVTWVFMPRFSCFFSSDEGWVFFSELSQAQDSQLVLSSNEKREQGISEAKQVHPISSLFHALQHHRMSWVGMDLKNYKFQSPCHRQGCQSLD